MNGRPQLALEGLWSYGSAPNLRKVQEEQLVPGEVGEARHDGLLQHVLRLQPILIGLNKEINAKIVLIN